MKSRFTKQKEEKLSKTKEQKSPGIELWFPALQVDSLPTELSGKPLPTSGSFPMSRFFASGGQSMGASVSVSVPPMNIQG